MFKSLLQVLRTVLVQFAETKYTRLLVVAAIIIPLVLAMYGYFDTVLFDSKEALNQISSYSITNDQNKTFPVGAYALAYMNVAQFDTCLTIISVTSQLLLFGLLQPILNLHLRENKMITFLTATPGGGKSLLATEMLYKISKSNVLNLKHNYFYAKSFFEKVAELKLEEYFQSIIIEIGQGLEKPLNIYS